MIACIKVLAGIVIILAAAFLIDVLPSPADMRQERLNRHQVKEEICKDPSDIVQRKLCKKYHKKVQMAEK